MKNLFSIIVCLLTVTAFCQAQVTIVKLPPGRKIEELKAHVTKPANIVGVSSTADDNKYDFISMKASRLKFEKAKRYKLNVAAFADYFHKNIKDSVAGYVLQVTRGGNVISNVKWNWAQTPADASQGWDYDTKMHVASVSKYITAMGMYKALKLAQLSVDTKIIDYLPAYWVKGSNIDKITFRHLLTHRAGFNYACCDTDYDFMKQKVAEGVSAVGGNGQYHNMNFGLCRILIPTVMKYINTGNDMTDAEWDGSAIFWYQYFTQQYIMSPAGVQNASFANYPELKHALAYNFPSIDTDGWDSGNLSTISGGAGWRLSVTDLLKIMDLARRHTDIFRGNEFQEALDAYLGIDQIIETPAGKLYNKNGRWRNNGRTEQSVIYFLPDDIEVAVLVNSKINNGEGQSLRGRVKEAYLMSLRLE